MDFFAQTVLGSSCFRESVALKFSDTLIQSNTNKKQIYFHFKIKKMES